MGMNSYRICPRLISALGTFVYKGRPSEPEVPGSNPGGPANSRARVFSLVDAILLNSVDLQLPRIFWQNYPLPQLTVPYSSSMNNIMTVSIRLLVQRL